MPPPTTLWDPEMVLKIGQILSGITCVGEAKTHGRRCHRHLARASCEQASRTILQISRMTITARSVDAKLRPLARLLLCKYSEHQHQVPEVVEEWRSRIQHFLIAQLEDDAQHETLDHDVQQDREIPDREIANARREIAIAHHRSEATCRELEIARRDVAIARIDTETFRSDAAIARQAAEAAHRVTAIARQETQNARRDLAMARQETANARQHTAIARQEVHTLRLEAARNTEVVHALVDHVGALSAAPRPAISSPSHTIETPRQTPPTASSRHPDSSPNNHIYSETAPSSLAAGSRAERQSLTIPSSSNQHSVPMEAANGPLASVGECSICLHRLGDEGIVQCVARCQKPFHGECIDAWLEERTICPLW